MDRARPVDAHRDHSRRRRAEEPGMPAKRVLEEIRDLSHTGSLNPLHQYVGQGRLEGDRIMRSPRRVATWTATRPENLPDKTRAPAR
ncbi:hypothetical protein ACIRP2_28160 [Streptomyces sp. NPDC101194]|uniref:hypothetical protein n=1 Tax=Streptomyces sp. NPDC101194 TaxID=3366127 RepID=UPI00382C78A7